jgi:hypothetical protein
LENLLSTDNVFILKQNAKTYLVPLWHHEMSFETDDPQKNLIVKCFPILPDNVELDEWNKLSVRLQYNLLDLWKMKGEIEIEIGNKIFYILKEQLKLTDQPQIIEYTDCGVPYNNTDNVLDDSKKQSVEFIITIYE